jgi:glycosyltransferase involved in cell wall biosynthesis
METIDYLEIINSLGKEEIESLYAGVARVLKTCTALKQCVRRLQEKVRKSIPCITDEFSSLCYARFFIERLPLTHKFASLLQPMTQPGPGIEAAVFSEIESILSLRRGQRSDLVLRRDLPDLTLFSGLAGAATSGFRPDPLYLLSLTGRSAYVDSMVARVLRNGAVGYERDTLCSALRKGIIDSSATSGQMRLFLDLAAELKILILDEDETARLMMQYREDEQVMPALLRYGGENALTGLSNFLGSMLDPEETSIPALLRFIETLAQLGDDRSVERLRALRRRISGLSPQLSEYLDLSIGEITGRTIGPAGASRSGRVLVQCIFYGDVALPGQAGGGGLTTFLNDLGNTLVRDEGWEAVYTLVLLPVVTEGSTKPLMQKSGTGHHVIRVPVFFPLHDEAKRFMMHEYELKRAIRISLEWRGVDPDLFHIRYTDNASLAVMSLGHELGKQVVFTLTPDPHRNFVDREGKIQPMTGETLFMNLNKLFIADELVREADGLLLIGHGQKNNQVPPYFPQLMLDRAVRTKPLEILAEGVRPSLHFLDGESAKSYVRLLSNHEGRYVLDDSFIDRPIMLNVGRLNPLKGQHLLVETWARSALSERFNLVLIGGNLQNPDPTESEVLDRIDEIMTRNDQLRGRFSHLSAVPNPKVRLIEQSIVEQVRSETPNVYVCSSFKEEFGISILEAMAAGFLILAPQNGGVSSYVKNGENGFLIDTKDAPSLREDMEIVLDTDRSSSALLHEIAARGRQFVRRTFNIDRVAESFSRYYESIL